MHWNYRVVKDLKYNREYPYSIREVYYNENDEPYVYDAEPYAITAESVDELAESFKWVSGALGKPVIDLESFKFGKAPYDETSWSMPPEEPEGIACSSIAQQ